MFLLLIYQWKQTRSQRQKQLMNKSYKTPDKTLKLRPLLWIRISGLLNNPNNSPITPRLVSRRYSKGRVLLTVCKKGYRKSGMCAARNADLEENNNQIQSPELSSKDSKHSNFRVVNSVRPIILPDQGLFRKDCYWSLA